MPWLSRTTALVWGGAALLLLALIAATTLHVERQRVQALDRATTATAEAGRVAAGALNRALLRIDTMLVSLPRMLAALGAEGSLDGPAFLVLLRELNQHSFLTRDIQIFETDGSFVTGALPTPRRHPPRLDREVVDLLLAESGNPLRLSRPSRNRLTGEWTVLVGRRLDFTGRASALAVAELPLESTVGLIAGPSAGLPVLVTLRRADGIVLATVPHRENLIGARLAPIAPSDATGAALAGIGEVSGGPAVMSSHAVSNRSLVVRAAIDEAEALARWSRDRQATIALAAAFAVVIIGAALALSLATIQRERDAVDIRGARRALQEAIDSMADGFVLFDHEDRFVTCNRRHLELFPHLATVMAPGMPYAEIAEVAARVALPDATPEQRRAWIAWRDLRRQASSGESEQHVGGRIIQTQEWRTASGGRACSSRDVTERKRVEAGVVAAKEEAEAASRSKSRLLAGIGRDLRAPLEAILGVCEMIREGRLGDEALGRPAGHAADIDRSARRLLEIMDDVVELSRVEAGRFLPTISSIGLKALIEACAAAAAARIHPSACDLEILVEDATVRSDERALRRIVLDLLSRAVACTPAGRISLVARLDPRGEVEIRIADTGIGSQEAHQDGRLDDTELGRSIAAEYLRALGGRIEVEGTAGAGTTIVLTLPSPVDSTAARVGIR
jgi:signal transduction histidine kinase